MEPEGGTILPIILAQSIWDTTMQRVATRTIIAPRKFSHQEDKSQTTSDSTGSADKRRCTNAFSGNFLNWASGSAIDMYRLALSGGDRSIDTPTLTILQRAMIPNGDPICMWRYGYYFPKKILRRDGGGTGAYW